MEQELGRQLARLRRRWADDGGLSPPLQRASVQLAATTHAGRVLGMQPGALRRAAAPLRALADPAMTATVEELLAALDVPGEPRLVSRLHQLWHRQDKDRAVSTDGKVDARSLWAASQVFTPPSVVAELVATALVTRWCAERALQGIPRRTPIVAQALAAWGCAEVPLPAVEHARPLREWSLLDPFVGCGDFILVAFEVLADLAKRELQLEQHGLLPPGWATPHADCAATVCRVVAGLDIDPVVVAGATAASCLQLAALYPGQEHERPEIHVARTRQGVTAGLGTLATPAELADDAAAHLLARRWSVVATNPPFVGFRKLDRELKDAVRERFPASALDLYAACVDRCHDLLQPDGTLAVVTPASWLSSSRAVALRQRMISVGGPRLVSTLGQGTFADAPLLFVATTLVDRQPAPDARGQLVVRRRLHEAVTHSLEDVRALPHLPFAAPLEARYLRALQRLPRLGDFVVARDGTVCAAEALARDASGGAQVPPQQSPVSGGVGYRRWHAPTTRMLAVPPRPSHGDPRPGGGLEYGRVAGGKICARWVVPGSRAQVGVVTLSPRSDIPHGVMHGVSALLNSAPGTVLLRSLVSGINANPGYVLAMPAIAVADEQLIGLVETATALRVALDEHLEGGPGGFRDLIRQLELEVQLAEVEMAIDDAVCNALELPGPARKQVAEELRNEPWPATSLVERLLGPRPGEAARTLLDAARTDPEAWADAWLAPGQVRRLQASLRQVPSP